MARPMRSARRAKRVTESIISITRNALVAEVPAIAVPT